MTSTRSSWSQAMNKMINMVIVGVPLFAVIYDIIKKLVFHGLRRNGQLGQVETYHEEFGDPDDPAPAPAEAESETEIVIDSGEE